MRLKFFFSTDSNVSECPYEESKRCRAPSGERFCTNSFNCDKPGIYIFTPAKNAHQMEFGIVRISYTKPLVESKQLGKKTLDAFAMFAKMKTPERSRTSCVPPLYSPIAQKSFSYDGLRPKIKVVGQTVWP